MVVQSGMKCGASQFEEEERGGGAEHESSSNGLWAMGSEAESRCRRCARSPEMELRKLRLRRPLGGRKGDGDHSARAGR